VHLLSTVFGCGLCLRFWLACGLLHMFPGLLSVHCSWPRRGARSSSCYPVTCPLFLFLLLEQGQLLLLIRTDAEHAAEYARLVADAINCTLLHIFMFALWSLSWCVCCRRT
jgi:hypothetical protein